MPYPMPYPYALPDDPYAPAPAYHAPALGRVKIQVSLVFYYLSFFFTKIQNKFPLSS